MNWLKAAQSKSDADIMDIVNRAIGDARSRLGDLLSVESYELFFKDKNGNPIRSIKVTNEERTDGQDYEAIFDSHSFEIKIVKDTRDYYNALFHEAVHAMQDIRNQDMGSTFGHISHKREGKEVGDAEMFSRAYLDKETELHAYALQAMNWGEEKIKEQIKEQPLFAKPSSHEEINRIKKESLNGLISLAVRKYNELIARGEDIKVETSGRNKRTVPLEVKRINWDDGTGEPYDIYYTKRFLPETVRNKLIEKYKMRIMGYIASVGKKEYHI